MFSRSHQAWKKGRAKARKVLEKKIGDGRRLNPPTGEGYQAKVSHPVRTLAVGEERSLLGGSGIITSGFTNSLPDFKTQ